MTNRKREENNERSIKYYFDYTRKKLAINIIFSSFPMLFSFICKSFWEKISFFCSFLDPAVSKTQEVFALSRSAHFAKIIELRGNDVAFRKLCAQFSLIFEFPPVHFLIFVLIEILNCVRDLLFGKLGVLLKINNLEEKNSQFSNYYSRNQSKFPESQLFSFLS